MRAYKPGAHKESRAPATLGHVRKTGVAGRERPCQTADRRENRKKAASTHHE